jgi:hypothetical protein
VVAKIKTDRAAGLTDEIDSALKIACEFSGLKMSQFLRIAALEKLVREGYMQHPGLAHLKNNGTAIKAAE